MALCQESLTIVFEAMQTVGKGQSVFVLSIEVLPPNILTGIISMELLLCWPFKTIEYNISADY